MGSGQKGTQDQEHQQQQEQGQQKMKENCKKNCMGKVSEADATKAMGKKGEKGGGSGVRGCGRSKVQT